MQKADRTGEEFQVYVNTFCTCGWLMELTESGVTYCENPRCAKRASAYRVVVKFEPITEVN